MRERVTSPQLCPVSFSLRNSSLCLEEYEMENKRRGLALIFNQEHFEDQDNDRRGTNVDRDNLEKRYHFSGSCGEGTVCSVLTVDRHIFVISTIYSKWTVK